MKRFLRSLLVLCFAFLAFESYGQTDEQQIRQILDRQIKCWNKGDLECFMNGYWKNDSLVFIGKNGPKYGWQTTLDNYKKSYPDKQTMGILVFDLISLRPIGKNAYFVIGKWALEREVGNVSGYFTLLWKKIDDEWVIVADHSS